MSAETCEENADSVKTQYVYDAGGSVVQSVTAGVVNSYAYTPFGEQLGTAVSGFGYNGEYFDAATGMLNLRARQYEPGMMRFSQQDILRGDLGDAVSLNRYAYCHNNPLSFSDPSGMSIFSKLKSAAKSAVKAVKSTAKAVAAKAVSTAAKVTASVAKTVSKVATAVNKAATTVAKAASNIAAKSNCKLVKSLAKGVSNAATKVAKTSQKVATTAKKVEKAATQVAKKYDKIATDSMNEAKEHMASAAKDFNAAAKEAKEKVTCVAKKAGEAIDDAIREVKTSEGLWNFLSTISKIRYEVQYVGMNPVWVPATGYSHYSENVAQLSNPNVYTLNGYIENQNDAFWGNVSIGYSNAQNSGCGAIATYNALTNLNDPTAMADIIDWYENNNFINVYGYFGVNPFYVDNYFTEKGYNCVQYNDNSQLPTTMGGDSVIVSHWNNKDDITAGAHFVALTATTDANGQRCYVEHNNNNLKKGKYVSNYYYSLADYYAQNSNYEMISVTEITGKTN